MGLIYALLVVGTSTFLFATDSLAEETGYLGYKSCTVCHTIRAKDWQATKHYTASDALNAEQKMDPECMSCHGTGAEQGRIGREWGKVQCEACHGPGKLYIRLKSWWGVDTEGMRKLAVDGGFLIHEEKVCLRCHGQDRPEGHPQAKTFNYKEAYKKVAHKRGRVEYPIH